MLQEEVTRSSSLEKQARGDPWLTVSSLAQAIHSL
jgi:hypothetical protein